MIPYDIVEKILDAARIEDVVGDFVTLKKRGANYTACCPFHNEKTPSFSVSPAKGIYKCFGCGKSGTAVGFVMEHESLSYVEALKYLAKFFKYVCYNFVSLFARYASNVFTDWLFCISWLFYIAKYIWDCFY